MKQKGGSPRVVEVSEFKVKGTPEDIYKFLVILWSSKGAK